MCEICQTVGVLIAGGGATVAVGAVGIACHLTKKKLKKSKKKAEQKNPKTN